MTPSSGDHELNPKDRTGELVKTHKKDPFVQVPLSAMVPPIPTTSLRLIDDQTCGEFQPVPIERWAAGLGPAHPPPLESK